VRSMAAWEAGGIVALASSEVTSPRPVCWPRPTWRPVRAQRGAAGREGQCGGCCRTTNSGAGRRVCTLCADSAECAEFSANRALLRIEDTTT
jgi:hypothetical protein